MEKFWKISLSSLFTMLLYLFFSSLLTAFLEEMENNTLALCILCILTTVSFGVVLLFVTKIKNSVGDNEIMTDYKDQCYDSWRSDFRIMIKRESKMLITICLIVLLCFLLNKFDAIIFHKKTISVITALYFPLCVFDVLLPWHFLGYFISGVADCITYVLFLMFYRKYRYAYWMKKEAR